ncbi:hypothetical protein [Celeribacter halophilus]|uniref:hypothetical protein n=1 Tax=Celeribacter halophilus TaxID=576117 RepID=UPI003A94D246
MPQEFESFQIPRHLLTEHAMFNSYRSNGERRVDIFVLANTAAKIAAWTTELDKITRYIDVQRNLDPACLVMTVIFVKGDKILGIARVIAADREGHGGSLLETLAGQQELRVLVFENSGRSVEAIFYADDFWSAETHTVALDGFPTLVDYETEISAYNAGAARFDEEAALHRVMAANDIETLEFIV